MLEIYFKKRVVDGKRITLIGLSHDGNELPPLKIDYTTKAWIESLISEEDYREVE